MSNILTYSIAREFLEGYVGSEWFAMPAFSGGGRGRLGEGAEHSLSSYDVFRKEKNTNAGHTHGGPIPPGIYLCEYVAHHPTLHACIHLTPTITSLFLIDAAGNVHFYNRDGLYIHGRGQHGSDACIVPENPAERSRLNLAVKNAQSTVMLRVIEPGMLLPAARETAIQIA